MRYVIKCGEYYVRTITRYSNNSTVNVELSKEIMTGFSYKEDCEKIAKSIGGVVEEVTEEVTNE